LATLIDLSLAITPTRQVVQSLGDELAEMAPDDAQGVVALLVERVETRDRSVIRVAPTRPA
jgi:hypothetical protein